MKPLIILLLLSATILLPGLASAQDQTVPVKTSDGAVVRTKQEALPVKPGAGGAVSRTFAATQAPSSAKPASMQTTDKSQAVTNTSVPVKIPTTTSTLPTEKLFKPVVNDARPPIIEQQSPANSNRPVATPKPANQ